MARRIVTDPAVCHGKPTMRGTRVQVSALLGAIAGGDPLSQVADDYGVSVEDVRAAVAYANDVLQREQHVSLRAKAS
ncbi:MAG: DUF433 domain-containing protein [Phycisphaerales bacterium]|nr:DUF433 domain-containing protein [Phycisphaerales bacterium]